MNFFNLAKDPHCLFALDAANGGTLRSRFRPSTYRNFAVSSYQWNDFISAQNAIGSNDVELEINLYWNYDSAPTSNVAIFAITAANNAFYIYAYTNGAISLYTNLIGSPYSNVSLRTIGSPLERGYHKITARVIGGQLIGYIDSETPKTYNGTRQTGLTFTAQVSHFNGNILSAKLTDLTTSTIVWQASDAQIKNSDAVYPSAVPRNFLAEPATWYDFRVAALALGTHDWQFEIDFLATENVAASSLWHVSGYVNSVNIYIVNSNYYNITLCKDGVAGNNTSITFRPSDHGGYGRHKIRVVKIGSTATVYINGVVAGTFDGFGQYWISSAPYTGFNSTLFGVSLVDLSLQKTVWQYPSFEEQTRLITKTNVWTENGCFEQASSSSRWAVSTPLSLTGMAAALTFVCRCKFVTAASGFQVAFGDGNPLSGNPSTEGLHLTYWVAGNLIRANMRTTAGGALLSVTSPAAFLDKWVTYALVIDSESNTMKLYADGILIGSVVSANISQVIGGYTSKLKISSDIAGVAAAALNQVKNLLVFDRTLSIGEIQLLR